MPLQVKPYWRGGKPPVWVRTLAGPLAAVAVATPMYPVASGAPDPLQQAREQYDAILANPTLKPDRRQELTGLKNALLVKPNLPYSKQIGWSDNVEVFTATNQTSVSSTDFWRHVINRLYSKPSLKAVVQSMQKGYDLCITHADLPKKPVLCAKTYALTTRGKIPTVWNRPANNPSQRRRIFDQRLLLPIFGPDETDKINQRVRHDSMEEVKSVVTQQLDIPTYNVLPNQLTPSQLKQSLQGLGKRWKIVSPPGSQKGLLITINTHGILPPSFNGYKGEGSREHHWLMASDKTPGKTVALSEKTLQLWIKKYIPKGIPVFIADSSCFSGAAVH